MADLKISALTASTTPLAGTEVLPIVQSSTTKQVSVANLTAGRAVSALSYSSTTGANFATSSGNVGVGTASPVTLKSQQTFQTLGNAKLGATNGSGLLSLGDISSSNANAGVWRGAAGAYGSDGNYLCLGGYDGITFTTGNSDISTQTKQLTIDTSGNATLATGNLVIGTSGKGLDTSSSIPLAFKINGSEAFRIDTTKSFCIGDTGNFGAKMNLVFDPSTTNGLLFAVSSGTFTKDYVYFQNSAGSKIGSIASNNSIVIYNTTSDYRIKTNVQPITGALAKVAQLNPVTYDWTPDFAEGGSQGFIAHELQAIVPDCVTGKKDELDENGKPKYQGVDTSFLVATLTAAIKELKAEFDAYKASHP
jgi:hypothetical protein